MKLFKQLFCKHKYTKLLSICNNNNIECEKCGHQIFSHKVNDELVRSLFNIESITLPDGTPTFKFSLRRKTNDKKDNK